MNEPPLAGSVVLIFGARSMVEVGIASERASRTVGLTPVTRWFLAGLAMKQKLSIDFSGYWQRRIQRDDRFGLAQAIGAECGHFSH